MKANVNVFVELNLKDFKMKIKEFAEVHKEKFEKKISKKTGWGKNELMQIYDEAMKETLWDILSVQDNLLENLERR